MLNLHHQLGTLGIVQHLKQATSILTVLCQQINQVKIKWFPYVFLFLVIYGSSVLANELH